jgi:hypothetical protein
MTEAEWLTSTDPTPMLDFLWGKTTDRKLRLFACACCRRIWHLLTDERSRCLVKTVEQYADGLATIFDVSNASDIHENAVSTYDFKAPWFAAMYATSPSHCQQSASEAAQAVGCATWWESIPEDDPIIGVLDSSGRDTEAEAQCLLLRDILGNPFRPASRSPAWLTPTALALAQAAYDNPLLPSGRLDKAHLAVLADALEEADCTNLDILNHCRQSVEHVRGCWVLDLLLGKQ